MGFYCFEYNYRYLISCTVGRSLNAKCIAQSLGNKDAKGIKRMSVHSYSPVALMIFF